MEIAPDFIPSREEILAEQEEPKTNTHVVVYGTLKRGYGNNQLLKNTVFVSEISVADYRLFYSFGDVGFPVAQPHKGSQLKGELWQIQPEDTETIKWLDRLEGEGRMYNRIEIRPRVFMYVGHPKCWNFDKMEMCPVIDNHFVWGRS